MKRLLLLLLAAILAGPPGPVAAQPRYAPGASDTEIRIGNIVPYSGPASVYSVYGKVFEGYFNRLNEQGGINKRKINFILLDNAYSPPKAVEQIRKLVEDEGIFAEVGTVGTVPNVSTQKYMNEKKVPQLFVATGATKWDDPKNFPWTMG